MTFTAIDIGNSRVKIGLFENNKLHEFTSFTDNNDVLEYIKVHKSGEIGISSVVPEKTKSLAEGIKNSTGRDVFIITGKTKTNLKISYKTSETLGKDRLCSAEGAFFLFRNSEKYLNYNANTYILSIDFGTATTVNVVEFPGNFVGGLIAPGIGMMFESLKQKTAQLPLLNTSYFISTVGNDTNSSIASGVVTSVAGMIEKTINFLRAEKSARDISVYVTGGNAEKIKPYLNFDFIYEEGLVLYGINALRELNQNR